MSAKTEDEQLKRQIAYYKKKVDELAGENLKADYTISGLQHSLKQKQQGFALLSELQLTIGSNTSKSQIYEMVIEKVNGTLAMDRTLILTPGDAYGCYRAFRFVGFTEEEEREFKQIDVAFPKDILEGKPLVVSKKNGSDSFIEAIRATYKIPYFVVTPIQLDSAPVAILLSGRLTEAEPIFPALDEGDVDTFTSIAGLISATLENMKISVLQELDRLKTQFFANLSHEFRTPITLTLGPLEGMLNGRYGPITPQTSEIIETIIRNQKRLLRLINQILDLSKLESGKMEVKVSLVRNINEFLGQRVRPFVEPARKKGIQVNLDLTPIPKGMDLYWDYEKMDTLFFNLLSNAFKFTSKGEIKVSTEIKDQNFVITVADSGQGIRPDQLPHIFDRFRQADGSESREHAGTGIGLSLVKEIVGLHGGHIEVFSEYRVGTRFVLTYPFGKKHFSENQIVQAPEEFLGTDKSEDLMVSEGVASGSDRAEVEELNRLALTGAAKNRPLVLYAEDNRDLRLFVHGILSKDYRVLLATDGAEGLEMAKAYEVDLILSDLMMPKMTGSDFLIAVKSDPTLGSIPFVLLTAKADDESKIGNLEIGVDDYLSKPFSETELIARVKNLVLIREQQKKIQKDLNAARFIQMSLAGPVNLRGDGFKVETLYHPSATLSGDFYDVILDGPYCYFYVVDITSHGIASAQVTYIFKGIIGEILRQSSGLPVDEMLYQAASRFISYNLDYAAAVQLARYDTRSGELQFAVSSSPNPILVKETGSKLLEATSGPYIHPRRESFRREQFCAVTHPMKKGERFYFFTDGCYELPIKLNPDRQMGLRKFVKILEQLKGESWKDTLLKEFTDVTGLTSYPDDITVLCLTAEK